MIFEIFIWFFLSIDSDDLLAFLSGSKMQSPPSNVTACQVEHLIDLIIMFVLCLIQRDSDI